MATRGAIGRPAGFPRKTAAKNAEMHADVIAERVARNQSTFRDANEQLERSAEELALSAERVPFICECPDAGCRTAALLSLVDYENVRSRGAWFLTSPGHEVCVVDGVEVAKIVERNETFSLMEKIGQAGRHAEQLDPRG